LLVWFFFFGVSFIFCVFRDLVMWPLDVAEMFGFSLVLIYFFLGRGFFVAKEIISSCNFYFLIFRPSCGRRRMEEIDLEGLFFWFCRV
jgi:hypothetical protein